MKNFTILVAFILLSCNQNKTSNPNLNATDSIEVQDADISNKQSDVVSKIRISSDVLIIPGKSIGSTNLLDDAATLEKFGKPAYSDAAMGKAWMSWTGSGLDALRNKASLAVYVTYNDSDMSNQVIKRIRVTSPDFKTAEGVNTGMTFIEITRIYSKLELDSKMSNSEFSKESIFYILKDAGISFEFQNINNSEICTAIAIASADEISNHPYLMLDAAEIQR